MPNAEDFFEPKARRDRNEALEIIVEELRDRLSVRNHRRAHLEGNNFAALRRQRAIEAWATARDLSEATGIPRSTVYRDVKVLARRGILKQRLIRGKDPRGPPRVAAYQLSTEFAPEPRVDPDQASMWLEVGGRRYPMVNEWVPAGPMAVDGWIECTTADQLRERKAGLQSFLLLMIASREAHGIGLTRVAEFYAGIAERDHTSYLVSPPDRRGNRQVRPVTRPSKAPPIAMIDELLDSAEAGEEILLRSRGVAGRLREPFDLELRFTLEPKAVRREKKHVHQLLRE